MQFGKTYIRELLVDVQITLVFWTTIFNVLQKLIRASFSQIVFETILLPLLIFYCVLIYFAKSFGNYLKFFNWKLPDLFFYFDKFDSEDASIHSLYRMH